MRSLSIGNSFSEDACAYLHQTAASAGTDLECVNLYIGGCSLALHAENLRENKPDYLLEVNGKSTERHISIPDALGMGEYDFITLQQASHFSGKPETYFPYIRELYEACRKVQPGAEILIHETWAYEHTSTHGAFPDYGCDQRVMYESLKSAYADAARVLGVRQIPVGDVVQFFREGVPGFDALHGEEALTRDGFHLSIPTGRFIAALVWFEVFTGSDARSVRFLPDGMDEEKRDFVSREVHRALGAL